MEDVSEDGGRRTLVLYPKFSGGITTSSARVRVSSHTRRMHPGGFFIFGCTSYWFAEKSLRRPTARNDRMPTFRTAAAS